MVDPRTPVVVGAGQTAQRVPPAEARPPIELFTEAARAAEQDSGTSMLTRVDTVAMVQIVSWPYADAGAFAARLLGIEPRATAVTTVGGNSPQLLVGEMADAIRRGDTDVVLLGGAESMYTRWRARRQPRVELPWETGGDGACSWVVGDDRPGVSDFETAHGAVAPTTVYPLFETALRAAAGRSIAAHQEHISTLWARFASVAAENPHAWSRTPYSPEEIRTVTADNRMVCFPYPKRMCSNIDVDQGAAIILCSYEAARAAGVADDRMVFLHAAADGHDHWLFSERAALHQAPGIGIVAGDALAAAGVGIDEVAHLDLYSCFPAAVQMAMQSLGIADDDPRPLTVTGGLGFAGGPVNNYGTHGIARMVDALRADPDAFGLTTGLGWYATKHAAAVWSARPPATAFRRVPHADTQARIDALPRREPAGTYTGRAVLEASSVGFDRDGAPRHGVVTALAPDGRRVIAAATGTDLLRSLTEETWEGRTVRISDDASTNRLEG